MRIAFISCWANMRIYATQAYQLKWQLEGLTRSEVKVVTSNCGCYCSSIMGGSKPR